MAGGTQSLDSTPKIHESSPIEEVPQPVLNPTPRKRARMGGGRADGVPFSGLCMYFEDEELDEIDYPNRAHRQVKQEIQEDDDMLGALDIAEDTSDDANFGADLAAEDGGTPTEQPGRRDRGNLRIPTGRHVCRPVSLDMNSDDEIIVSMKRKHISDTKIANYLRETGRVNYSAKTIGTRFMRIRAKIARARDEDLDAGVAVWRPRDDGNLMKAAHLADVNVTAMKEAAESKKWELTSRELSRFDSNSSYSSRACKERFEKLQDGTVHSTATLPTINTPVQQELKRITGILEYYSKKLVDVKAEAQKELGEALAQDAPAIRDLAQDTSAPLAASDRDFSPSRRAMDVDSDLTGLDTWMLRTMRMAKQDSEVEKRLDGLALPEVDDMTGIELHAELLARGLVRDGRKEKLASLVKDARNGSNKVPRSILPPDVAPLRELLAKRAKRANKGRTANGGSARRRSNKRHHVDSDDSDDNY